MRALAVVAVLARKGGLSGYRALVIPEFPGQSSQPDRVVGDGVLAGREALGDTACSPPVALGLEATTSLYFISFLRFVFIGKAADRGET